MLSVYLDDTGNDGRSAALMLAGYVAREGQWEAFIEEWQAELDREPKIECFHMVAAEAQSEAPWDQMTRGEVTARVEQFAAIPPKHAIAGLTSAIMLADFDARAPARSKVRSEDPLYAALMMSVQSMAQIHSEVGLDEGMSFVFDKPSSKKGERRLKDAFGALYVLTVGMPGYEGLDDIKGISFWDDRDMLPLQAADLLAWQMHRRIQEPDKPQRKALEILLHKKNITGKLFSISLLDALRRQGFPDHLSAPGWVTDPFRRKGEPDR